MSVRICFISDFYYGNYKTDSEVASFSAISFVITFHSMFVSTK